MIYMTPQSTKSIPQDLDCGIWGQILTPIKSSNSIKLKWWCLDNGCFTGVFNHRKYLKKLEVMKPCINQCKFVTLPDVVTNSIATLQLWRYWYGEIKMTGFPLAFVAQDGQENLPLPPDYDCLFVGGSTEWKLSHHVDQLIKLAKSEKKWVHVGRVNSQIRIEHFQRIGVHSVDGTGIIKNPPQMYKRLGKPLQQLSLFE